MNIGINLFGPAKRLYKDFNGTADKLREIGFSSAELCLVFGDRQRFERDFPAEVIEQMQQMSGGIWAAETAGERIAAFRQRGFVIQSAHIMTDTSTPENWLDVMPAVKAFGVEHGFKYFVISLMKSTAAMRDFVPAVNQAALMLAEAGIQLAYHNHEVESMVEDGTTALDLLMEQCPQLKLELDVGWAKFAGASAIDLMKKYGERIVMLHFKDVRADASPENRATCFTAVGEGSIPLQAIMAAVEVCRLDEHGLIIDQDDSESDILDDLRTGFANISAGT